MKMRLWPWLQGDWRPLGFALLYGIKVSHPQFELTTSGRPFGSTAAVSSVQRSAAFSHRTKSDHQAGWPAPVWLLFSKSICNHQLYSSPVGPARNRLGASDLSLFQTRRNL
jgi:hypothetical protein